jgi:sarcosine oxidase subunit gamma
MADPTWVIASDGLAVSEIPGVRVSILRLPDASKAVLKAVAAALGAAPPIAPNHAIGGEPRLLWLAPDEWAIVSRRQDPQVAARLARACEGALHHLADLMEGWTAFTIEGDAARGLIARGCSLDLHPRAFAPDRCARTLMAQVPVLIERPSGGAGFVLYVDRSLAAHMRDWLAGATSRPTGLP